MFKCKHGFDIGDLVLSKNEQKDISKEETLQMKQKKNVKKNDKDTKIFYCDNKNIVCVYTGSVSFRYRLKNEPQIKCSRIIEAKLNNKNGGKTKEAKTANNLNYLSLMLLKNMNIHDKIFSSPKKTAISMKNLLNHIDESIMKSNHLPKLLLAAATTTISAPTTLSGDQTFSDAIVIESGATLALVAGSSYSFNGNIDVKGSLDIIGDSTNGLTSLQFGSTTTITNSGNINLENIKSAGSASDFVIAPASIDNSGTFTVSQLNAAATIPGTNFTIAPTGSFINTGTIDYDTADKGGTTNGFLYLGAITNNGVIKSGGFAGLINQESYLVPSRYDMKGIIFNNPIEGQGEVTGNQGSIVLINTNNIGEQTFNIYKGMYIINPKIVPSSLIVKNSIESMIVFLGVDYYPWYAKNFNTLSRYPQINFAIDGHRYWFNTSCDGGWETQHQHFTVTPSDPLYQIGGTFIYLTKFYYFPYCSMISEPITKTTTVTTEGFITEATTISTVTTSTTNQYGYTVTEIIYDVAVPAESTVYTTTTGTVSVPTTSTFTSIVTNSNGSSSTEVVIVIITPHPSSSVISTTTTSAVTALAPSTSYTTTTGDVSALTISTYTTTVTNSNGSSSAEVVVVIITPHPSSSVISTTTTGVVTAPATSTLFTTTTGTVSVPTTSTFTSIVTNSNGSSSAEVVVVIITPHPSSSVISTTTTSAVTAPAPSTSYTTTTGDVSALTISTYTTTVTNSNGSSSAEVVVVIITPHPSSSVISTTTTGVVTAPAPSTSYTTTTGDVSALTISTYTTTVTNSNGSSSTEVVVVVITPAPATLFTTSTGDVSALTTSTFTTTVTDSKGSSSAEVIVVVITPSPVSSFKSSSTSVSSIIYGNSTILGEKTETSLSGTLVVLTTVVNGVTMTTTYCPEPSITSETGMTAIIGHTSIESIYSNNQQEETNSFSAMSNATPVTSIASTTTGPVFTNGKNQPTSRNSRASTTVIGSGEARKPEKSLTTMVPQASQYISEQPSSSSTVTGLPHGDTASLVSYEGNGSTMYMKWSVAHFIVVSEDLIRVGIHK
ncbi:hypothetical protein RI543_004822 [Arxiozyma heterogenica]|uniref:Uncharacterized protein n=1 Tax=Arxiozyma heterogenica TaxID=278026 RepID=A0AAN7WJB1_9SACH|nr:hypothetical protein RI543_004822 [Kazachstania heterogenica]